MAEVDRREGRRVFGADPANYHSARPAYPDWVFETLVDRCGLRAGAAVFEIGAGTGAATRRLLDLGADPLAAIEPDPRLAAFLRDTIADAALHVVISPFEDARLDRAGFDLGVSATAFHWVDEDAALARIAELLRPGGWWAMVWNVFGDDSRPDPFHEATSLLLNGVTSPSASPAGEQFALDPEGRRAALDRTGAFEAVEHRAEAWSLALDPDQTVRLYGTYSNINVRADREAVLAELGRIAREQFAGRVTRNMITSLYVARRR
jgi:SAM-dependent methyltransferase